MLVTAAAVGSGLVQGTTANAAPPHSVPYKTVESIQAVSGKGCRVSHHYKVDASSAKEAFNIHSYVVRSSNGQNNGTPMTVQSSWKQGQTQFTITAYTDVRGVATQDCIASKVAPHRGRDLRQIPSWARGVLAGLASTAVYIAVTVFATAAAAVVTGGTGSVAAAVIGGCVGGALSAYVGNALLGITNKGTLIGSSLFNCLAGASGATVFARGIARMETWIVESATVNALRQRAVGWADATLYGATMETRAAIRAARARFGV
ncbi:hypothetical protein [Lentzea flaviverrucosa]|uniref:hypothetical protein n=1 Tax=Lentzea flaviverrucosa TaxID=200379 RepID=UPI000B7D3EBC|nr:hypothetical protein [Lentzea flaviverrucosa]